MLVGYAGVKPTFEFPVTLLLGLFILYPDSGQFALEQCI